MVPSEHLLNLGLTAAALAAVLGLIYLSARGARWSRSGRFVPARRLQLIETLMLDRTRRLQIVRWDGREHLLLTGGGSDVILDSVQSPALGAEP